MKQLSWRVFPVLASAAALVLVPLAASAATGGDAVARAARVLGAQQRDYAAAAATWSWARDGAKPAANTAGLVALGLVAGWERTGDLSALRAAVAYGEARLNDLAAWRPLYDPDVEALAALARATGDERFAAAAAEAFERRWGGSSGVEALARLHLVRKNAQALVGFDAALTLRAATAVGQGAFARDLADALLKHWPGWRKLATRDAVGHQTISRAAFLGALVELDAKRYAPQIQVLSAGLAEAQGDDGSWAFRNTQATAYAVRALARVGSSSDALSAAERGARWLEQTQLSDGSWATFHDGLPEPFVGDVIHEVTAEAALALAEAGR